MFHARVFQTHEGVLRTNAPSFDACKFTWWSRAFGHRTALRIITDVSKKPVEFFFHYEVIVVYRMFIGPCIIVIDEELKTNLMSLVIFISLALVLQPAK